MPFGVENAPSVFQRLMQSLLLGLRVDTEQEFVDVYLDDIIVFSRTLVIIWSIYNKYLSAREMLIWSLILKSTGPVVQK